MYEWRNAKVTGNLRKAFEIATDVAWKFNDEKIRSAYMLFAALNDTESVISKTLFDLEMPLIPDIEYIAGDKELFTRLFGEKGAERFFEKNNEEASAENNDVPTVMTKEQFKDAVIDVVSDLVYDLSSEDVLELMIPTYSDKLELACDDAYERCKLAGRDHLDLDTLICCVLENKDSSAYKFMEYMLDAIEIDINDFIQSLKIQSNVGNKVEDGAKEIEVPQILATCVEIVNKKYEKGEEITILGRDNEIFKAFNIFSKKTKRNAVLVGEPGVGKTAIIEAITQEIVNETCPKEFIGYTVLSLDVNSMVAGTKYRGEFETKVAVLKQFLEGTPNVILFVDEMHQMLGAGGTSEGTVDLSGSLKPILSRDDVVFVGATTVNEYNNILSRDGAFKRRFEVIMVKEPKNNEVKEMIKAKLKKMEQYHGVKMPTNLMDYIILCSNCLSTDTCNPDKTLDLCDRSMAICKMSNKKKVTKTHINKVYEEYFKHHESIDKKEMASIAYHEIGHYIVTMLTKERKALEVTAISIIPTRDYLGVNKLEWKDNFVSADKEYFEANIMSLLAGRVAQHRVTKTIDSGASSDLKKAKEVAKEAIAEFGMDDEEYKNIYLMDTDLFNEKLAEKIDEKANKLLKKVYEKTEKFIDEHWSEIDKMAKYLIKNKIVTSDELQQFIEN